MSKGLEGLIGLFSISQIQVGKGQVGLTPMPTTVSEVQQVINWRADMVISLTEKPEFSKVAHPTFLQGFGGTHLVLPIPDYSVPNPEQSAESSFVDDQM